MSGRSRSLYQGLTAQEHTSSGKVNWMSATARCSRSLLLEIDGRSVTSRWTRSVRCDASYDAANLRFEGGL